ncbi:MAG: diacylglycerol/lipid kinase family protein [Pyrinomonadaceae bacterium]
MVSSTENEDNYIALGTNTKNISGDAALPLVIVNPKSASGSTREKWSQTASDLRAHFGPFSVAFTKGPGDGIDLASRAAESGRQFIIACGGDGTINEVANGILRSGEDVELGVLPSGTGGDFRRTLGMPLVNREASAALRDGETRTIDVGKVSFLDLRGNSTERYFVNVSSFGLAASIIKRVKSASVFDWLPDSGLRGRANFAASTLREIIDMDPVFVRVKIDGRDEETLQTINFCVANARYFGGGMMIAPEARINDGLLDVVNIGDIKTAKILLNAYTLYSGAHASLDEVKSTVARKVKVSALDPSDEILLETDGELPGKLSATYEVVPNALRVRVPKPAR